MGMGAGFLAIGYLLSVCLGEINMTTIRTLFSGVPPVLRTRLIIIQIYWDHQSFTSWAGHVKYSICSQGNTRQTHTHQQDDTQGELPNNV